MFARLFGLFRRRKAAAPASIPAAAAAAAQVAAPGEPPSLTSMLQAQIEQLGGPKSELDRNAWIDTAHRVADLASAIPPPPSFPSVATRVIAMARDPELDLNELVGAVQRDAAIATTLLRVANSVVFAPPAPITTLRGAIQMLGIQQVVEVVLGGSCRAMYEVASQADLAMFPDLWRGMFNEAMGNAFTSGRLALEIRDCSSERALLAGLLADVGRPIALRILGKMIRDGMARPDEAVVIAILDEVAAELGARTVLAMNLPHELRSACVPDDVEPTKDSQVARMVSAIGAIQRRSPRLWTSAGEVRRCAERIALGAPFVRTVFAQRTQYVQHATAMFAA
ncbi:MAG: HDOD domain-containing protein [Deltaproteobacteria bacterium]|nr:HDOD domain-containing protein [Deltaproteobacteria bacterium]MCW5809274.1 HDOD domain-containing protein [Deltaproteobacteria bacterium]